MSSTPPGAPGDSDGADELENRSDELSRRLKTVILESRRTGDRQISDVRLAFLKRRLLAEAAKISRRRPLVVRASWLAAAAALGALSVLSFQYTLPTQQPPGEVLSLIASGDLSESRGAASEQRIVRSDAAAAAIEISQALLAAKVPFRMTFAAGAGDWVIEAEASVSTADFVRQTLDRFGTTLPADGHVLLRISPTSK